MLVRRTYIKYLQFATGMLLCPTVWGQVMSDTLREVEVKSQSVGAGTVKDQFNAGAKSIGIDSATRFRYQQQSVAALLTGVTTAFVKSYGFNSFATVSFRGASAAQSAVYWEGIPLMNAATGLTDVSLLPVALMDSISLDYGSNAALYGSGNVGGAVMLRSGRPTFADHNSIRGSLYLGGGSFGQRQGNERVSYSSKQLYIGLTLQAVEAKNDFPSEDETGRAFTTEHAAQSSVSGMLTAAYRINSRNTITASGWLQRSDREIPRATFEGSSQKEQWDKAYRGLVQWERRGDKALVYAKVAMLTDSFRYKDDAISLYNNVRTTHWYGELGWEGRISDKGQLLVFAPVQLLQLLGMDRAMQQSRVAIATALSYKLLGDRLIVAGNGRVESFDETVVVLPGVNAIYKISKEISVRINAQETYRAPTLSELYYEPGGNKDLKPEQGWSVDGGYSWNRQFANGSSFSHSGSVYDRQIKDWIIWLGGAIWTPHNLASVHSRGIETENTLTGRLNGVQWKIGLSATYTVSTPTESYLAGDNSIGKQLPYVPKLSGSGYVGAGYKGLYVQFNTGYTGRRFITSDESNWLSAYAVGDLYINYKYKLGKTKAVGLQGSINNIWNAHYTVVGFRPMPGINYLMGIIFDFE